MMELFFVKPDTIDEVAEQQKVYSKEDLQQMLKNNDGKTITLQVTKPDIPEGWGRG